MKNIYKKYSKTLKTILWGFAGIIVSLGVIKVNNLSLFAWPLFVLSILMFALAIKYYLKERN